MSSYVEAALIGQEKILYIGRVSVWSLLPQIVLGFVLLPAFGAGLILWAMALISYLSTELAITDKRVIAKFGFIRRETIEINLNKVESLQVIQGILGRIFDFGSLVIHGVGMSQAPIPGISDPMRFRKIFIETQDRAIAPKSA